MFRMTFRHLPSTYFAAASPGFQDRSPMIPRRAQRKAVPWHLLIIEALLLPSSYSLVKSKHSVEG